MSESAEHLPAVHDQDVEQMPVEAHPSQPHRHSNSDDEGEHFEEEDINSLIDYDYDQDEVDAQSQTSRDSWEDFFPNSIQKTNDVPHQNKPQDQQQKTQAKAALKQNTVNNKPAQPQKKKVTLPNKKDKAPEKKTLKPNSLKSSLKTSMAHCIELNSPVPDMQEVVKMIVRGIYFHPGHFLIANFIEHKANVDHIAKLLYLRSQNAHVSKLDADVLSFIRYYERTQKEKEKAHAK